MWDTDQESRRRSSGALLSHDLPCRVCGHAAHTFLACSDDCACVPPLPPGSVVPTVHAAAEHVRLTA